MRRVVSVSPLRFLTSQSVRGSAPHAGHAITWATATASSVRSRMVGSPRTCESLALLGRPVKRPSPDGAQNSTTSSGSTWSAHPGILPNGAGGRTFRRRRRYWWWTKNSRFAGPSRRLSTPKGFDVAQAEDGENALARAHDPHRPRPHIALARGPRRGADHAHHRGGQVVGRAPAVRGLHKRKAARDAMPDCILDAKKARDARGAETLGAARKRHPLAGHVLETVDHPAQRAVAGENQERSQKVLPRRRKRIFWRPARVTTGDLVAPRSSCWAERRLGMASVIRNRNDGKAYWFMGNLLDIKLSSEETGGETTIIEMSVGPKRVAAPPHIHSVTETAYVIDGNLRYRVDGRTIDASAGSLLYFPKGTPEWFENTTDRPARLLITYSPGGMDRFFREVAEPATRREVPPPPTTAPDFNHLKEVASRYGLQITGPVSP